MANGRFINTLLANILKNNNGVFCRFCLKEMLTPETSLGFDDMVTNDKSDFHKVHDIINLVLGVEATSSLPGLNSICLECVQSLMEYYGFLMKFRETDKLLNNVFDNVCDTLCNVENGCIDDKQMLFLVAHETDSQAILTTRTDMPETNKDHLICQKCNRQCYSKNDLQEHQHYVHGVICDICNCIFFDQNELDKHIYCSHTFRCNDCPKMTYTKEEMRKHISSRHRERYICKQCGQRCYTLHTLEKHESTHTKMICSKCSKTYVTVSSFVKHRDLCLSGRYEPQPYRSEFKQSYICYKCGKGYGTAGGLRVHKRFAHENAVPHKCPYCVKTFTAPSYLKAHLVTHTGEKKFHCNICNKNFVTKEALLYHTRRHTGEKPYKCKHCEEKFVNASSRAEHIKYKHSAPTLTCHMCPRKFVTKFFLKKHVNKHFDPSSKLFMRNGPADVPSEENRRFKLDTFSSVHITR